MTLSDSRPVEHDLVERALRGDRDALEQLLLLRYEWLASVAYQALPAALRGERQVTDDVLQDSFVRILRGFAQFRPQGGEPALFQWLKTIVQNTARDAARKQRRLPALQTDASAPPSYSADDVYDLIEELAVSTDPRASAVAREHELMKAFQDVLAHLDPTYRQVIELLYFQHRSVAEAATEMGVTEAAVRGYRGRARDKIRESLVRLSNYI
ncbi:MAG: RNA polymerase sigma factor [Pirellulaceae bacterium]